jgi:hypothetical protein
VSNSFAHPRCQSVTRPAPPRRSFIGGTPRRPSCTTLMPRPIGRRARRRPPSRCPAQGSSPSGARHHPMRLSRRSHPRLRPRRPAPSLPRSVPRRSRAEAIHRPTGARRRCTPAAAKFAARIRMFDRVIASASLALSNRPDDNNDRHAMLRATIDSMAEDTTADLMPQPDSPRRVRRRSP